MPKPKHSIDEIRAKTDRLEGRFDRASAKTAERTVDMSFSSELPVERWYGMEVLSHDAAAVDLERLSSGRANLLVNHDPDDWVGVIESARIDGKDKVGRATVRFGSSARATEVFNDVRDGILSSVSVGYRRMDMKLTRTSEEDGDEYTVTRWTPFEVSLVTIPADETVGVGRAAEVPLKPAARVAKEPVMSPEEQAAADAAAKNKNLGAVEAEKERRQAIINLCKSNKIDSRVEVRWIEDGTPLTVVAKEILDVMEERGRERPARASELGLTRNEAQRFSLFRALRTLKNPASPTLRQQAAFEVECSMALAKKLNRGESDSSIFIPAEVLTRPLSEEVMKRAMATTPGSKGGYMVNVQNMGFIDILRNRSVAMAMGARNLSGLEGNVTFPRQTGKSTVTWQGGEGASVTASDQALGQLSMTPKTGDHRHRCLGAAAAPSVALGRAVRHGGPRRDDRDRRRRQRGDQRDGRRAAAGYQEHHRHHERPGRGERDLREDPGVRLDRRRLERHPRQPGLRHQHRRRGEADAGAALHLDRHAGVAGQHARTASWSASTPCRASSSPPAT
jgi:HK97 family phage prohead protease